jgi:L-cysteine desulfidase
MKLRCRFSAMIRCASGSIQVVTNVARFRIGSPSRISSSATSLMASTAGMLCSGISSSGARLRRKRLP